MGDNITTNLRALEDMILDEEKLITYISLCRELCIHVNESKILLSQALQNIRRKHPNIDLNVNYILSGIKNENIAKTVVCTEPDLETLKNSFNVIFFQHIYSINKGRPKKDCASLLATNKLEDFVLCHGIIKSTNCVKHTANEIAVLKSNSQDVVSFLGKKSTSICQKKIKKEVIEKLLHEPKNMKDMNCIETEEEKNIEPQLCLPEQDVKGKQKLSNLNIKQTGIVGFFNKTNSKCGRKDIVSEVRNKENNIFEKYTEKKVKGVEVLVETDDITKHTGKDCSKNNEKNDIRKENRDKTQTVAKKNMKVDKKRKRVLLLLDSDSDNDLNDNAPFVVEKQIAMQNESEDEIPPTPSINTVKITSGIINPRKKRKIVDKTYTSDNGYIITRKEEIYESCSENDEEVKSEENITSVSKIKTETSPKEKKNETKNSKKKVSPYHTGKQSTLMNYFKKSTQ